MKRYKFQAMVTLDQLGNDGPASLPPGQMRRMVVRGQHHHTSGSQIFSAMITNNGDDSPWLADDHIIVTIVLVGEDPREYLDIGDTFALWLGGDIGRGVVTRRLFV